MRTSKLERTYESVVALLLEAEPLFIPEAKLTFVMRVPGNTEAEMVVSGDDLTEVEATVRRCRERNAKYGAESVNMSEEPSRLLTKPEIIGASDGMLHWESPEYYGTLRVFRAGFPVGNGPFKVLGISAIDETARPDWREFQQLKNYLVGEEWEGVELYPAESRLVDPSNRFYLWCVPKGVLRWGLPGRKRHVIGPEEAIAPQRPFPEPHDSPKEAA